MTVNHVSYSSIKTWYDCPFLFKLKEVDKVVPKQGSIHTAFGNGMHLACEEIVKGSTGDLWQTFTGEFKKRLMEIDGIGKTLAKSDNRRLVSDMGPQAKALFPEILPALKETFGDYRLLTTEQEFLEPIKAFETQLRFKGFIDLVLHTPADDKFHMIDWKTTSWGWDGRRKAEKVTGYQLSVYKHFLAQKLEIDPEQIETYFALLKRTAKPKKKVEIFRITSGKKKISNALDWVKIPVVNIEKNYYPKRSSFCGSCPCWKTALCP